MPTVRPGILRTAPSCDSGRGAPKLDPVRRLLLATNNPGKVREFRRLLQDCSFEIVTPAEIGLDLEVEEDANTYAENAALKARAFADASGLPALADDSGIEVDALGGRPGLRSARYGDPGFDDSARNRRLLEELSSVDGEHRTARYRAVVAVVVPGGSTVLFEGVQEGSIACAPRGEGGFGYDPIFLVDGERTQAEIPAGEKDRISHRARACRQAAAFLESLP